MGEGTGRGRHPRALGRCPPGEWPAGGGPTWREEWLRRLETNEPWLLTWLRENRESPQYEDRWKDYQQVFERYEAGEIAMKEAQGRLL